MKRALAVAAGIAGGVLLAGVLSPVVVIMLPPRMRGAEILWVVTGLTVAIAVWASWSLSGPRRS